MTAATSIASSASVLASLASASRPKQRCVSLRSTSLFGRPLLATLAVLGAAKANTAGLPGDRRAVSTFALFSFGGPAQMATQNEVAAQPDTDNPGEGLEFAAFGAGCFWGPELAFQRVPGVVRTEVGYTQGLTDKPTYEDVCSGRTNHVEAVRVAYDPKVVSFEQLLDEFWRRHNPTHKNRQGNDVGTQYRSGIYFYSPEQEAVAKAAMAREEQRLGQPLATELKPAKKWYRAEEYHQQYLSSGGRFGFKQSPAKGCNDPIRCYG